MIMKVGFSSTSAKSVPIRNSSLLDYSMAEYVLAITTCPPTKADTIAMRLVESKTCACANIVSRIKSIYHWKGNIETDTESILLLKTEKGQTEALWEVLKEAHPYDVPEFIVIPIIHGSPDYLNWISDSIS